MAKIAVEEPLTDVQQELNKRGYNAEMLDRKVDASNYDCVVVRDKEDLADMHMNIPLVEAKGRSVNEIVEKVGEHLDRIGKEKPKQKKQQGMSSKSVGTGLVMGTIVGAAIGILMAPTEGKNVRNKITTTTTQTKQKTSDMVNKAKNMAPGGKKEEETTEIAPKEQVEVNPDQPANPNPEQPIDPDRPK